MTSAKRRKRLIQRRQDEAVRAFSAVAKDNVTGQNAVLNAVSGYLDLDPGEFDALARIVALAGDDTLRRVQQVLVDLGHDAEEIEGGLMAAALALVSAEADIAFARMQMPGASARTRLFMRRLGKLRGRLRAGQTL